MAYAQNLSKMLVIAALLILIVPFASAAHLITGYAALPTLDLEVEVPAYSQSAALTLEGRTKALASVHAFVNDARVRVYTTSESGRFLLSRMPLSPGANTLRLEAREGDLVVTKEYVVISDGTPPYVSFDEEIPAATRENTLTVSGSVDEPVTIYYRTLSRTDAVAPEILSGLVADRVEANAVELIWDPSIDTDFQEYLILRDGERIATSTLTSFRDENLLPDQTFTYSVSAVDDSCNIGTSADISATTQAGSESVNPISPTDTNLSCETAYETTTTEAEFDFNIILAEGRNELEIIFEDAAGNQEVIMQTVVMDATGPSFIETNLEEISPSYIPEVTIKGQLNEQATVFVYINEDDQPSEFEVTDPDGSFSIKINLRTDRRLKKGPKIAAIEIGEGWVNKIRLEAVDLAGNTAGYGPTDVQFLICGEGTWWQTNVGEALPSILLPRLMIQGIQQIGIPFNISYIGGYDVKLGRIDVRPIPLSPQAAEDFDHDWVYVNEFTRAMGPRNTIGYVQVEFVKVDPLPDKPGAGANEKELALSKHRQGECLVPGIGCAKLFLQMEIQFQEIIQKTAIDPNRPIVSPEIVNRVQKLCMPVEVAIDQVIPIDVIPKGMLRNALSIIDTAMSFIDKALTPLTTIGNYLLYGCLGSNVWLYVEFIQEKWTCEASSALSAFGDGKWDKSVAQAGLCEKAYADSPDKQAACTSCQKKIESRTDFEADVMHGLCDRIGCPSAPTFNSYIRVKSGRADPIILPDDMQSKIQTDEELKKWAITDENGKSVLYVGNDCAFVNDRLGAKITPTYSAQVIEQVGQGEIPGVKLPEFVPAGEQISLLKPIRTKLGIRNLYDIAKGKEGVADGPTAKDCKKTLHPANPNCCGVAYQRDWSSACGTGTVLGEELDFFDELKESTCLSAQQANIPAPDLKCNRVWNSVAGFCEKNTGQPTTQTVSLGIWKPRLAGADGNTAYLFVDPVEPVAGGPLGSRIGRVIPVAGGSRAYKVYAGFVDSSPVLEKTKEQTSKQGFPRFTVGGRQTTEPLADVTRCFGERPTDPSKRAPQLQTQTNCLYEEICKKLDAKGYKLRTCTAQGNIKNAVNKVNDIIQIPLDPYIVRPNSGFLRSVQCACIPAITSYLYMWQQLLGAFHGCFSKILLTGEGSEGFCAARLSAPICDLMFEFISCFVQKFKSSGARAEAGPSFGNILGVMTGAGTEVTKSVNERYGGTPLYRSLFSERKLVHAVCTWAFTGTWDLNVEGLFQQQVQDIPVETMGALTTCERTFISYDPTTSPTGLSTWAYRIAGGLIAGADVDYRLKIKCSSGYNCDPRDYADGKCDCETQERIIAVNAPGVAGRARKYDVVDFDAPFAISAQSAPNSDIRYDTAMLEYTWTDPQTRTVLTKSVDCSIGSTEGGRAPPFCALDLFSGKFRCLWNELDYGIQMIEAKPQYPENQEPVFVIGDPLEFYIDIKQIYSTERSKLDEAKKILTYEIKDNAGTIIKRQDNDGRLLSIEPGLFDRYTLTTDGTYRFTIPKPAEEGKAGDASPLGGFEVNKAVIEKYAKGRRARYLEQTWPISLVGMIKNLVVSKADGLAYDKKIWFSIYFPKFGADSQGEENYEIHRITPVAGKTPQKDRNTGWATQRSAKVFASGKQSSTNPENRVRFNMGTALVPEESVEILFKHIPKISGRGGTVPRELEILIEYIPSTTTTTPKCDTDKDNTPITWNAVFSIYDADRHGNPTEQLSIDPATGQQQQRIVPFSVQCADKEDVEIDKEEPDHEEEHEKDREHHANGHGHHHTEDGSTRDEHKHEHEEETTEPSTPTGEVIQDVVCPVTGDEFAIEDAFSSTVYKGTTYYFCCKGCVSDFNKDPEAYAKKDKEHDASYTHETPSHEEQDKKDSEHHAKGDTHHHDQDGHATKNAHKHNH